MDIEKAKARITCLYRNLDLNELELFKVVKDVQPVYEKDTLDQKASLLWKDRTSLQRTLLLPQKRSDHITFVNNILKMTAHPKKKMLN